MTRTLQGVFLADGTSDLPLARHIERICLDLGRSVTLTPINPARLPAPVGRTVAKRLELLLRNEIRFDIAFVHRDAEAQDPQLRADEIAEAAARVGVGRPIVPVVPVRMTEAWLLLDEPAIRRVAGRPTGRAPLGLPQGSAVERVPDPKGLLKAALATASEATGRRRARVTRDFDLHRSLLMERLDPTGPITQLAAWQELLRRASEALRAMPA